MSITLQHVAAAAGVSPATVSKVINKRYDVAPETVELVEKAMLALGYQRGATRRGRPTTLRAPEVEKVEKQVTSLALLITSPRSPVQTAITGFLIDSIEATARERGLHFLVARLGLDGGLPPCLDPVQVDGLILRSPSAGLSISLPQLPSVWVFKPGWAAASADLVLPDNERIGQMAANYLLERGNQHLAVINPWPGHPELWERADRFLRFARSQGVTPLHIEGENLDIAQAAAQLAAQRPKITGLFFPGGNHGLEILHRELASHDLRPGDGLDFLSCSEDRERLQALNPLLPRIDIRVGEIGRVAAETLLWRIRNPHDHRRCILIEPQLT